MDQECQTSSYRREHWTRNVVTIIFDENRNDALRLCIHDRFDESKRMEVLTLDSSSSFVSHFLLLVWHHVAANKRVVNHVIWIIAANQSKL